MPLQTVSLQSSPLLSVAGSQVQLVFHCPCSVRHLFSRCLRQLSHLTLKMNFHNHCSTFIYLAVIKYCDPKNLGKERFTAASNSKSQSVPGGSQGRCVKTILACYSTKHCVQPRKLFHRQRSTAGTMVDID